ncbi:MAG: alpha/beta fold hydrolase [Candidatus Aminicenantes bacterium]|nr:alpha/beta fold hydrolase [Candidatus Aminicenantes bacterium]
MKEKIHFENSQGTKLCGILSNPTDDTTKHMIILCHGFSTGKDGRTYMRLEEILNEKGISTFRFDFFGHGESEGKFEEITTSEAVDDVLKAIKFIKGLDYKRIGLVGSSFGGMASIFAASQSDDLYILTLKSPVSDYKSMSETRRSEQELEDWKDIGFLEVEGPDREMRRLNYSFYEDAEKVDAYKAAKQIKVPTLIVHGDADETVPIEQSIRTASLIENCHLEIIEGCDHTYSQPEHFEKLLDLISEFIFKNS